MTCFITHYFSSKKCSPCVPLIINMKAFGIAALLLVHSTALHDCAANGLPTVFLAADLRQAFLANTPERRLQRSNEQCQSDTRTMISDNWELHAAYQAALRERNAALEACVDDANCEIDDAFYASTSTYGEACKKAGGTIYELYMELSCVQTDGENVASTLTTLRNIDHCYAASSCSVEALLQEAEEEAVRDLVMVEQVLIDNGIVAVCDADFSIVDDRLDEMSGAFPCHHNLYLRSLVTILLAVWMCRDHF